MIKRIELINFMSHSHTVIEPAAGLTVLIGPNNCGKSAIVAALQILAHNAPSTYVLRHGTKECKIIVETDDGHTIEWSRKKSGSPSYKIDGEPFDRLRGSTEVWEKLARALRLPLVECDGADFDVHFGEQRNPVFLLGDKGKKAAQFFASSSDASRLVEMQAVHKANVKARRSEHRQLTSQADRTQQALELFEPLDELTEQVGELETQFESISQSDQAATRLEKKLNLIGSLSLETSTLTALARVVAQTPAVPDFEDTRRLERLGPELAAAQTTIARCNKTLAAISELQQPPSLQDEHSLADTIHQLSSKLLASRRLARRSKTLDNINPPPNLDLESIEKLSGITRGLIEAEKDLHQRQQLAGKAQQQLAAAESEIEDWVQDNPTCPTCGGEMSAAVVLDGGHAHE